MFFCFFCFQIFGCVMVLFEVRVAEWEEAKGRGEGERRRGEEKMGRRMGTRRAKVARGGGRD